MALQVFRIPLTTEPQRFNITLKEQALIMQVRWNHEGESWVFDMFEGETETPILLNMPLVTGVDLLAQHKHLNFSGSLVVTTDGNVDAEPMLDNLGEESNIYYIVEIVE